MQTIWRFTLALVILLSSVVTHTSVSAHVSQTNNDRCQEGTFETGALWLICVPEHHWNGDVIVLAHGYVAFNQPLGLYNLELPGGISLPDLAQSLGFAFATTSYRQNGLAILEGTDDIRDLVNFFPEVAGQAPRHTYLMGMSQGGIITTLLMEQSPHLFSGALSLCGPVGDFQSQLNYIADFRLLFDYFFPNVLPGGPTAVPPELIEQWWPVYVPMLKGLIAENPETVQQLLRVSGAAVDPNDPASIETTVLNLLWYNIFTTNDAVQKLNGNPYHNVDRWYAGSDNDVLLNRNVPRFAADPTAQAEVQRYETIGQLTKPTVMLHTTGDEIIPAWHQELYSQKAGFSLSLVQGTSDRYGHCNFTAEELLVSLSVLVLMVNMGDLPVIIESIFVNNDAGALEAILQEISHTSGIPIEQLRQAHEQLGL